MADHSKTALEIVSRYALASEIRDELAAAIDKALADERERCAQIAETYSNIKPDDVCIVHAAGWQAGIAGHIRHNKG